MRVLALDYGSARCGCAVSDPTGRSSRRSSRSSVRARGAGMLALVRLVREREVERVVVGLPLSLRGGDSEQTRETREFAERLARRLGDERAGRAARRALHDAHGPAPGRRGERERGLARGRAPARELDGGAARTKVSALVSRQSITPGARAHRAGARARPPRARTAARRAPPRRLPSVRRSSRPPTAAGAAADRALAASLPEPRRLGRADAELGPHAQRADEPQLIAATRCRRLEPVPAERPPGRRAAAGRRASARPRSRSRQPEHGAGRRAAPAPQSRRRRERLASGIGRGAAGARRTRRAGRGGGRAARRARAAAARARRRRGASAAGRRLTRARAAALLALLAAVALVWFLLSLFQPFAGRGQREGDRVDPKGLELEQDRLDPRRATASSPRASSSTCARCSRASAARCTPGASRSKHDMSYSAAIDALSKPPPQVIAVKVVIPEGYTRRQIADLVAEDALSGQLPGGDRALAPARTRATTARRRARATSRASSSRRPTT